MHMSLVYFLSPMFLYSTMYLGAGSWDPEKYTSQKPFLTSNEVLTVGAACWGWEGIWNESKCSLSASAFCQFGISNRREHYRTSS